MANAVDWVLCCCECVRVRRCKQLVVINTFIESFTYEHVEATLAINNGEIYN